LKRYAVIEKKVGETPLQALEFFRQGRPELAGVPLTYAGRLDPMAQGKILILIGDECKKRERYDGLDKEYEFEVLLGFQSDTGDLLGIADRGAEFRTCTVDECTAAAKRFVGRSRLPYPAFSSKKVAGKQLFQHALDGTLKDVEVPQTKGRVYRITFLGMRTVSAEVLAKDIFYRLGLQKADSTAVRTENDFRRGEVTERWRNIFAAARCGYMILSFRATVASGTYVRTLASLIAGEMHTCGLAYSIKRTKIGKFTPLFFGLGFWRKRY
jgi:tRNA pseudouridine(55) synthase